MTIIDALSDVMADVTSIGKGDKNDFHKFMFRGVDRVINEVGPALRRHRVVVLPEIRDLQSRDGVTEKGKSSREVTVTVAYTFHGPDGDSVTCVVPGEAQDTGDKAVSKAMSVAFRTALLQALTIPTQERDPDSQVYTRTEGAINGWKRKIMAEAESRGWDVDHLAEEFAAWSNGEDIREATLDQLQGFHEHLVPPKTTMKRAAS
jgi:ERF superfamily